MMLGHNEIVHVLISACLKICRVETSLNGKLHLLLQTSFVTCRLYCDEKHTFRVVLQSHYFQLLFPQIFCI